MLACCERLKTNRFLISQTQSNSWQHCWYKTSSLVFKVLLIDRQRLNPIYHSNEGGLPNFQIKERSYFFRKKPYSSKNCWFFSSSSCSAMCVENLFLEHYRLSTEILQSQPSKRPCKAAAAFVGGCWYMPLVEIKALAVLLVQTTRNKPNKALRWLLLASGFPTFSKIANNHTG